MCLFLGVLYALLSPVEYQSEARVLPEVNNGQQGQLQDVFKNYGGLLGFGKSDVLSSSSSNAISPDVYPAIIKSLNFQYAMLSDTVYFADEDTSMTLYRYFAPRLGSFYEGWLGRGDDDPLRRMPPNLRKQVNAGKITAVSTKQRDVIMILRNRLNIALSGDTGIMQITARMPDAVAAAQVCNQAIERLTTYVKAYRTQKAQGVLDFTNQQYQMGREKFRDAQRKLANFKDKNVNLSTATAQSHEQYLQSKYNLAYNIFSNIAQKRIQARMTLQKNTPVFKRLQSANVPLERASPLWIPIIIVSICAGLVISFLIIAIRHIFGLT